jgi:leucyl aminopeptidase
VTISFTVSGGDVAATAGELLAVPILSGRALGPGAEAVDAALDGTLGVFMEEAGFEGKPGETLVIPTPSGVRAKAALLVGVGDAQKLTVDAVRRAGAAVARKGTKAGSVVTSLAELSEIAELERADTAQALAEGIALGSYQFLRYKKDPKPSKLRRVTVLGGGGARVRAALKRGATVAAAVSWARDLVNEPSREKPPTAFVAEARKRLRGTGVTAKVLTESAMKAEGMGGVLGVGQGSERPPRFMKLTYAPARSAGTLALVGKGVVFDSGGLSLKTSAGMETMKTDMSGAAAVVATMSVLQELGVKAKVVAYVPLVENMPSGSAIRPGDVLTIRDGTTVEVLNTDAEGRLILADGLAMAVDEKPDAIVDVATLTGACMVALGDKIAGLMGNNDDWVGQVRAAADRAGEPVWPLPLPDEYRKLLDSEVADLRNISTGQYGGALTAGLFLREFVDGVSWAHLDIAGPARAGNDDAYLVKGGTGFGVRTLVELASDFRKPPRRPRVDG